MKKTIVTLVVMFFIIVLVSGILTGSFRKRKPLSDEDLAQLERIKSNYPPLSLPSEERAKEVFGTLWHEHVDFTRQFVIASLGSQADVQEKETQLLENQEYMGRAVGAYYPGSEGIIMRLLKEHIVIAKDIVEDLKSWKLTRVPSDISRWYDNADKFSETMEIINPNWKLKHRMREHLLILEYAVISQWVGLRKLSLGIYNDRIVPQAQEMADIMVEGVKNKNGI